jgi:hypothetical protein
MGQRVRARAVVMGLFLAAVICAITPFNNAYLDATPLAGGHFPLAPFFILLLLTATVTVLGRRRQPTPVLTGQELLVVWVLMVIVSGIAYTGLVRTFFINITAPYEFATLGNNWQQVLQPLLPASWYPRDKEAIRVLYDGLEGGRDLAWSEVMRSIPWRVWLPPLITWGCFVLLCYWVMLCLVNLLSQQWLENEKMNFPLLRVPQMMEDALAEHRIGKFFGDRFLLLGLLAASGLHVVNGLHFYFPGVPEIPTLILAGPYFPKYGLFSGFHKLKIYFYPAFIGFAFLTTRQIALSFWLFYLLGGLFSGLLSVLGYSLPAAALGTNFGPALARVEETQMIGAYGVFFLFILWLARHHFSRVLKLAFSSTKVAAAEAEYFSVRLSLWGLVIGLVCLAAWCSHYGMPLKVILPLLGVFFMVMIVASRVVCQGGVAYFTLTAAPTDGLISFLGSRFFGPVGLLMSAVMQKVLFVDLRESLMPSLVHGAKIKERTRNGRLFFAGVILALLIGVAISFAAMLGLCYKYGIRGLNLEWATQTTAGVYDNVQRLLEMPSEPRRWVILFSWVGAGVMLILVILYHAFYWWPVHPIGYLTTYSSAMHILWFSFLVGWLCNHLTLRYGGVELFSRVRRLFVGLIIGDFLMGGIWALIGLIVGSSYQVLPS